MNIETPIRTTDLSKSPVARNGVRRSSPPGRFWWCWIGRLAMATCLPQLATAAPGPERACSRSAAAGELLIDVPFEVVDGRIYVDVRVNDAGSFRFAVDSGASGMARADVRLVRALNLPAGDAASNFDGVRTADEATVRFDALALGKVRREGIIAISRNYNARQTEAAAFDGILARDFFSDGLLAIDFPQRRLRFRRDHALLASDPDTMPYTRAFRIPVSIGAVTTQAQMDTGANVTLVLPTAIYQRVSSRSVNADGSLTLSHGEVDGGRTWLDGTLRVGEVALRNIEARVSKRYPETLVGAHALQDTTVFIDQRTKRVAVCPGPHQGG